MAAVAANAGQGGVPGNLYSQADGAAPAAQSTSGAPPASGGSTWQEPAQHGDDEERISIPGTHVPAWVVVAIIVGVIALLAATAFFLLR